MNCPPAVREQLEGVDGVTGVEIDFDTKTATVTVEKGTDPAGVAAGLSGRFSGTLK